MKVYPQNQPIPVVDNNNGLLDLILTNQRIELHWKSWDFWRKDAIFEPYYDQIPKEKWSTFDGR